MNAPWLSVALVVGVGVGAGGVGYWLGHRAKAPSGSSAALLGLPDAHIVRVPRARGNIALDGDLDDPGWQSGVRTGAFAGADGVSPARPHSEARLVWADGYLYVGLYAADEDLHARATEHDAIATDDDFFHLVLSDGKTDRVIDVTPTGVMRDGTRPAGTNEPLAMAWSSDARVSVEHDGTLNDPKDHDEEWIVEMALPFEAIGLRGDKGEAIGLSIRRCDTLRNGTTSCGSWGEGPREGIEPAGATRQVLVLD